MKKATHCDFPAGWHWNSSAFYLFQCILLLVFPVEAKRNQRLRLCFLWSVTFVLRWRRQVCWRRGSAEVTEKPVTEESLASESLPPPAGERCWGPPDRSAARPWQTQTGSRLERHLGTRHSSCVTFWHAVISPCDHICRQKLIDHLHVMLQRRAFSTHHWVPIIKISQSLWKNNLGCGGSGH